MKPFPSSPALCLVTDRRSTGTRPLDEVVTAAVRGGVGLVQVREKDLGARELLELCRSTRLSPGFGPGDPLLLLVNDRLDVALICGLDGVHLGETSLPPEEARRLADRLAGPPGGRFFIGRSVHSREGALRAEAGGADYLIFGHVFATESKAGLSPRGLRALEETATAVRLPVLAIGGITPANCRSTIEAGASGVAVMSGIMSARDPEAAARVYSSALLGRT